MNQLRGALNAYWFNPRTGKWHVDGSESARMLPFEKNLSTKTIREFDPPGEPANENDWVLVLR